MNVFVNSFVFIFLLVFLISNVLSENISNESVKHRIKFEDIWNVNNLQRSGIKNKLCLKQMLEYTRGLNASSYWAIKMFDSTSKIQSGILQGNIYELGSFDGCLAVHGKTKVGNINGKYCLGSLGLNNLLSIDPENVRTHKTIRKIVENFNQENTFSDIENEKLRNNRMTSLMLTWSICVPDGCNADDITLYLKFISDGLFEFRLNDNNCQTLDSQPKWRSIDWVVIGFFTFVLCIIILSTGYDLYLEYNKKADARPLLQSFSIYSNGKSLLKISNNPDILHCLNGIRCISMMWVICGHQFLGDAQKPAINNVDKLHWLQRFSSQLTIGSTVSVDSFFLMSGCLLMYGFMKAMEKGVPFNIILYYIHRYIRLTPPLAALILFNITLYYQSGEGPFWPQYLRTQEACEHYWWTTLLYVQNYVNPNEMCLSHSWYLSVEMQLFWISPLIILPVWKYRRYALHILVALLIISVAIPFGIAWSNDLWIVMGPNSFKIYYIATYCRAGSWLVGIALGYILHTYKNKKIIFDKVLVPLYWLIAIVIMFYIVFAGYPIVQQGYIYNKAYNVTFIAFHRVIWSICLSWIIFACVHGYGGPVNWFLSLPLFQVLGRLTYCVYLVHFQLILAMAASTKTQIYFTEFLTYFEFWGDLVFCIFLGIALSFSFEYPIAKISSILLSKQGKNKTSKNDNLKNNEIKLETDNHKINVQ